MVNPCSPIRLVVRADDAGSFVSANEAIEQSIDAGIARNVSIMVPGPAFEDAVRRFAGRDDVCFGLHITLNAELCAPKWGPVAPCESVASLLDENGYFHPTPTLTQKLGFVVEEAMREVEAQLRLAQEAGFNLTYVDEHMAVSRIGIRNQIADLCRREGLIDVHGLARLPLGTSLSNARTKLAEALPGDYVWVTHPGLLTPETLNLYSYGNPNHGDFARPRDAERRLLTDRQLATLLQKHGVRAVRYSDLVDTPVLPCVLENR
jgi:hypothetical protein